MDWPVHKIICKHYTQFGTTRPDLDHHSAIYFSPNEPNPRFIWLHFESGHNYPTLEDLAPLGVSKERIKAHAFEEFATNPMLDRHIEPHHILVSLPEAKNLCPCCTTDVDPNGSLIKVDQELADFFRGPLLAFGTHCEADFNKKSSDLDLGPVDFRHVVDNLRMLYCQCEDDTRHTLEGGPSKAIKAVRLNCMGDTDFVGRPIHEAVLEPRSTLELDTDVVTPVADRIGMPLIVRKMPPAVVWRDARRPYRVKNFRAAMLNPPDQTGDTGSLILVRKDGKRLHPMHVQALISYTATKLKDPNHPIDACLLAEELLADRISQVSKEDFQTWYTTTWKTRSIQTALIPSPFDIETDSETDEGDSDMDEEMGESE
ncbi:hypothetical protein HBH56_016680 [Parastagonospora nodorum]|uniref:Uncharacterized protein n=2 Tax=Phaeosphaeria nodorum (strain SN15 / ATCC MYA-4574 / FGSC 10173) TaxID=321614 RepID=A0A7U2EXW3_PHANO|nr:hypothetical protein SNOG_02847 [Parastagonospora nodorum SN15]KAH3919620.1 hypothetical protein HBH56_016680 [Parastagonospora nodorum]EAT89578.2 hypothetical protein SNOG_02847 [Parastagonospora nodorum SN15]KAH3937245.1 hypothetical protein HBH54_017780 [Parastagonospora nodorum]KAH4074931.1 hypothetical protein HBH50_031640 [Parastagonospora nodorum]KAH4096990.1 hypothetical protein HBH48_040520 [Parastagonospora nodorum]